MESVIIPVEAFDDVEVHDAFHVFLEESDHYSIQLEAGPHELIYSYVGYELERETIEVQANLIKNLSLKSVPIDLPDVIIGLTLKNKLESQHVGEKELKPSDLLNMPEFAGESGIVKGLQTLPGVSPAGDETGIFVRTTTTNAKLRK